MTTELIASLQSNKSSFLRWHWQRQVEYCTLTACSDGQFYMQGCQCHPKNENTPIRARYGVSNAFVAYERPGIKSEGSVSEKAFVR